MGEVLRGKKGLSMATVQRLRAFECCRCSACRSAQWPDPSADQAGGS